MKKGDDMNNSRTLDYFKVENTYGGDQACLTNFLMMMGGCAAVDACDTCIYFARNFGVKKLYPFDETNITKNNFIKFSEIMKPYLRPRMKGINTLELYIDGFGKYLKDVGDHSLSMKPLYGTKSVWDAKEAILVQIDEGYPIPCLTLRHKNPKFKDYAWHWYMITGHKEENNEFHVQTLTYGNYKWFLLEELWDTGFEEKGGLVIYGLN
ncbi:hypothetical protein LQZ18_16810 [Lachnospiraceae bacterium ZAX-1]